MSHRRDRRPPPLRLINQKTSQPSRTPPSRKQTVVGRSQLPICPPVESKLNWRVCRFLAEPFAGSAQWSSERPKTEPEERIIECDECGSALRYSALEQHKNNHNIDRVLAYRQHRIPCDACGRSFPSEKAHEYHVDNEKCVAIAFGQQSIQTPFDVPRIEEPVSSSTQPKENKKLALPIRSADYPNGTTSNKSVLILAPSTSGPSPLRPQSAEASSADYYELHTTTSELTEAPWEPEDNSLPNSIYEVFKASTDHIIDLLLFLFIKYSMRKPDLNDEPCDTEQPAKAPQSRASTRQAAKSNARGSTTTRPSKRKVGADGEDQDDEDNLDESRVRVKSKVGPGNATPNFACHFAKQNPRRNLECLAHGSDSISHLKQHMTRARRHVIPYYCLYCFTTFKTIHESYAHMEVTEGNCGPGTKPDWHYMTAKQEELIKPNVSSSRTPAEQWYDMWDILFPGTEHPATPYVDDWIRLRIDKLEDYLRTEGLKIAKEEAIAAGVPIDDGNDSLLQDLLSAIFKRILEHCPFAVSDQAAGSSRQRRVSTQSKVQKKQRSPQTLAPPYSPLPSTRSERSQSNGSISARPGPSTVPANMGQNWSQRPYIQGPRLYAPGNPLVCPPPGPGVYQPMMQTSPSTIQNINCVPTQSGFPAGQPHQIQFLAGGGQDLDFTQYPPIDESVRGMNGESPNRPTMDLSIEYDKLLWDIANGPGPLSSDQGFNFSFPP